MANKILQAMSKVQNYIFAANCVEKNNEVATSLAVIAADKYGVLRGS